MRHKLKIISIVLALPLLLVLLFGKPFESTISASDGNTHETVFSIPIGKDGVHYQGVEVPEMLNWGPTAFTVAPDGSFWIADTVGNRLVHHSPKGEQLNVIELDTDLVGVGDIEATASDILVLDVAAVTPQVIRLTPSGTVLARYELPEGLRLEDGLSGIALGEQGEVLVEREGGAWVSQLVDQTGKLAEIPLDGYTHEERIYTARPADLQASDSTHGYIMVGDTRIDVVVTHSLVGLRILKINSDGSFVVIVEEMVRTPTIQVDQTVRHYDIDGNMLGMARFPLAEQYVYVDHGLTVGPDGYVYALITRPNRVEVQRLQFARQVEPILPAAATSVLAQTFDRQHSALLGCRSRQSMLDTAAAYRNTIKYLSATNTDGFCSGRGKPRYMGGAGTSYSVPYDWGGFDTVSSYKVSMYPGTYQAGDINTGGVESCSRGVDCSGYVSRIWGLTTKHGTWTLPNVSWVLPSNNDLQLGDILNKEGDHVVLFYNTGMNGVYAYESTMYNNYDRVVFISNSWSRFSGYQPRRYNNVCS